jgi:hypothetical protein
MLRVTVIEAELSLNRYRDIKTRSCRLLEFATLSPSTSSTEKDK